VRPSFASCFPMVCALTAGALAPSSIANAEIGTLRMIPVIRTQLTVTPPAPPARPRPPAPRPAPPTPPVARPPINTVAAPNPPAPAVALDQAVKAGNEQLQKQVGDLSKQVSDLSAQEADLRSQISALNSTVGQLQRQMAETAGSLKDAVEKTAARPLQQLELSSAIERGVNANIDRLLQSFWPNIAVLTALMLLLGALLGSMIIGLPAKALMYRVPARRAPSAASSLEADPSTR
jgi:ABC-type transporter Mla subunit MlaD